MADQLQRALVSVASNIAEGHPQTTRAFRNKLRLALGELFEAQTQVDIALRRKYITSEQAERFQEHATIVGKQMSALRRSLGQRLDQEAAKRRGGTGGR